MSTVAVWLRDACTGHVHVRAVGQQVTEDDNDLEQLDPHVRNLLAGCQLRPRLRIRLELDVPGGILLLGGLTFCHGQIGSRHDLVFVRVWTAASGRRRTRRSVSTIQVPIQVPPKRAQKRETLRLVSRHFGTTSGRAYY